MLGNIISFILGANIAFIFWALLQVGKKSDEEIK